MESGVIFVDYRKIVHWVNNFFNFFYNWNIGCSWSWFYKVKQRQIYRNISTPPPKHLIYVQYAIAHVHCAIVHSAMPRAKKRSAKGLNFKEDNIATLELLGIYFFYIRNIIIFIIRDVACSVEGLLLKCAITPATSVPEALFQKLGQSQLINVKLWRI